MIVILLACSKPDPQLQPYADAVEAWRKGQAAATPADALVSYEAAVKADPDSVVLGLWVAKAQADAGDLAAADGTLSKLLLDHPDAGAAWYNRAAYRARDKRLGDAAADLAKALTMGVRSPLEAAADPDFADVRTDPAFATLLPPQPVVLRVDGPDGSVFLGSRFSVDVYVASNPDAVLDLRRAGPDPGCVHLVRIVEDQRAESRMAVRHLNLDFVADGRCAGPIGTLSVDASGAHAEAPPLTVQVELPEGANVVTPGPLPDVLPVPSSIAPDGTGYAGRRVGAGVAALGRADQPLTGDGRAPDLTLEWRVDGQTRAKGGWWRAAGPVELAAKGWSTTVD